MLVFISILLNNPMTLKQATCIEDFTHIALNDHHLHFKNNTDQKNMLMISFGLLTDFVFLVWMGRWCIKGGSWRFMIALILVFFIKFFFRKTFMIAHPIDELWTFPGFYSLVVHYGRSNDYHYNTVTAVTTMLSCEFYDHRIYSLMMLSIIAMLGNFYLSLVLRGHYVIDNFGGFFLGFYFWLISYNWLSYYIDVCLFGMTLHERFPTQRKKCMKCSEPINQWADVNKLISEQETKSK